MRSFPDDALIEAAFQDFSMQFQSAFPLPHYVEFHDEEKLKEKILLLKENVSKNFFSKVWNRDREQVFSLLKELRARMNEATIEWETKNKKHRMEAVSFLQKRSEMLSEDFQMTLEDQLLLNPNTEVDFLKDSVDRQKLFAVNYFDGMWKHGYSQIKEERRLKMVKNLDGIVEEVLDKYQHVLERKSVDKGESQVDEVTTILMERSRQLKSYVESHPGRVSKGYLKVEVEDMKKYLLNGKGSALRESQREIYCKLVETLEEGIRFLAKEEGEGNANCPEDFIQWIERLDLKLRSYCYYSDEGRKDKNVGIRMQQETNECDTSAPPKLITVPQILRKDAGATDMTDNTTGGGREEIRIVRKTIPTANDGPGPDVAEKKGMNLRRSRPLSFTVKDEYQAPIKDDRPLPKKRKTGGNVSKKTIKKADTFVCKSRVNDESGNAASPTSSSSPFSKSQKKGSFICENCRRGFRSRYNLTQHMLSHDRKLFGCTYCDQRCRKKSQMMEHLLTHSDERPFSCATCKKSFCLKHKLIRHLQTVHQLTKENAEKQTNDACLEYLKKVTKNSNYDGDISSTTVLSHAIEKANLRIPDGIDRTFSAQQTSLKVASCPEIPYSLEQITILREDQPFYKCDVCKNEIKRRCELKYHGKNCFKKGRKCHHCGKTYFKKAHLVEHLRTHTGEKPFKCPTCDKQFAQKSNLQSHILAHSEKDPFICPKCKASFRHRKSLNLHMLKHEG